MWYSLGKKILQYKVPALVTLFVITAFMAWQTSKIELSYDSNKAVPEDNVKFAEYKQFLKQFGADNNLVVIGIESKDFFKQDVFLKARELHKNLEKISAVKSVMSIPEAVTLVKDTVKNKFVSQKIFFGFKNQNDLDSQVAVFKSLPIYKSLLYNLETNCYLFAVTVNKDTAMSKSRIKLINSITQAVHQFENETKITAHISGLPYIRTIIAERIKKEMNFFLIGSLLMSALVLLLFFRSFSAMLMSLAVVAMGVLWSFGTMVLLGYKITLLTALIPPLVVVIGIPNCIYFLNKYHTVYKESNDKEFALHTMIGRMGVVTLFCNIAAAIGFAVFALTKSGLLKEFGIVSGINIMALFFISLFFIPAILSYIKAPTPKQMQYLNSKLLEKVLVKIERWALHHKKWVYAVSIIVVAISITGIFRLKKEGFIVDDLPKKDVIYTDLRWFENNFKGIMPLEIVIDTKKKKGLQRSMQPIENIEAFCNYIDSNPNTAKPLSFIDGLKFSRQAYYDGDSNSFTLPNGAGELALMSEYMQPDAATATQNKKGIGGLMNNFIDSNRQLARISINMKDIGSKELPILIKDFEKRSNEIFDSSKYKIQFTGSSVTFLEGSTFIINGLKESIIYAFILIAICMLYLFKSGRVLLCSLVPNILPLIITAGVMGWCGIALKPSTVLVFSVALGIVIDVTIRFLVNYKQELPHYNNNVQITLIQTIKHTGISIIYTSLVLITGFIIFCFSSFGGTQALGWLTSLTLVVGTITNLVLLPVLMLGIMKKK
ncbi:MAG: MMPL family transporter [Bacteroidetes bacterium]|nr:MMPL family transporter [Bacteroidota bacterium]